MDEISLQLSEAIAKGQTFKNSDNIRVGRLKLVVHRVFADKMDTGRFAFAVCKVLEAHPNPQVPPYGARTSSSFDKGENPNRVGTMCAMKINFDGGGAKMAGANVKDFILGLMGFKDGEVTEKDVAQTWEDLSRTKPVKKGEAIGVADGKVILAETDKQANPACGIVVWCTGSMKEKKKTRVIKDLDPEKREYVTVLDWTCAGKLGDSNGENSFEAVAKRRAEIEANTMVDDDDDDTTTVASPPPAMQTTAMAPPPPAPMPPPPAPPAPFQLQAPWVQHPSDPAFCWSNPALGGNNAVKSLADLQAGR